MPTYKIDLGTAPDGWGQAASALAAALAPNPKAEIDSRLAAAQATNDYAGAYANEQLGRTRAADAALQERQNANVFAMDEELRKQGVNDPIKRMQIITANIPLTTDPDILAANIGDINLAGAATWGADDATMDRLSVGAGHPYTGTAAAFDKTMRNSNQQWLAEQAAARAAEEAKLVAEGERAMRVPVVAPENSTVFATRGDPRFTQNPGGGPVSAQTSVGKDEFVVRPDGQTFTGPNHVADAPKAPTSRTVQRGTRNVTEEWGDLGNGTLGWKVVGDAPRTALDGSSINPIEQAFSKDTLNMLNSALEAGAAAPDQIARLDQTIALLKDGVPTGFWTDRTMPIRQAFTAFGIADEATTGKIEKLTADLGSRVMARIQETKGAVSNSEMDYFRKISASIGQTPVGNLMLLEGERRVWDRAMRMRNFVETLQNQPPEVIREQMNQWIRDNPIFTAAELANPDLLTPNPATGYATSIGETETDDPLDPRNIDTSEYD